MQVDQCYHCYPGCCCFAIISKQGSSCLPPVLFLVCCAPLIFHTATHHVVVLPLGRTSTGWRNGPAGIPCEGLGATEGRCKILQLKWLEKLQPYKLIAAEDICVDACESCLIATLGSCHQEVYLRATFSDRVSSCIQLQTTTSQSVCLRWCLGKRGFRCFVSVQLALGGF